MRRLHLNLYMLLVATMVAGPVAQAQSEIPWIRAPVEAYNDDDCLSKTRLAELPDEIKALGFSLKKFDDFEKDNLKWALYIPMVKKRSYTATREFPNPKAGEISADGATPEPETIRMPGEFTALKYRIVDGITQMQFENSVGETVEYHYDPINQTMRRLDAFHLSNQFQPINPPQLIENGDQTYPYTRHPRASVGVEDYKKQNFADRTGELIPGDKNTIWVFSLNRYDHGSQQLVVENASSGLLNIPLELPQGLKAWSLGKDLLAIESPEGCEIAPTFEGLNFFATEMGNLSFLVVNLFEFMNLEDPATGLGSLEMRGYDSDGNSPQKRTTHEGSLQSVMNPILSKYYQCSLRGGETSPEGYNLYRTTTASANSSIILRQNGASNEIILGRQWAADSKIEKQSDNVWVISEVTNHHNHTVGGYQTESIRSIIQ